MLQDIAGIETKYDLNLPNIEYRDENYNLNQMYEYITDLRASLEVEVTQIKELEAFIDKHENALIQVKNIQSLDVPLGDLFACEYVFMRFGRLPNDSVDKLSFFQNRPFVFKSFNSDNNYVWCMYYTTQEYKREVDNIFSSLFFERSFIPEFVKGTPKQAIAAIKSEVDAAKAKIATFKKGYLLNHR